MTRAQAAAEQAARAARDYAEQAAEDAKRVILDYAASGRNSMYAEAAEAASVRARAYAVSAARAAHEAADRTQAEGACQEAFRWTERAAAAAETVEHIANNLE